MNATKVDISGGTVIGALVTQGMYGTTNDRERTSGKWKVKKNEDYTERIPRDVVSKKRCEEFPIWLRFCTCMEKNKNNNKLALLPFPS